jgi:hypothetical protein
VCYFHSHIPGYFISGGLENILLETSVADCKQVLHTGVHIFSPIFIDRFSTVLLSQWWIVILLTSLRSVANCQ